MSKRRVEVAKPARARHQHDAAVPVAVELGLGHQLRAAAIRRLHEDLVVADLAEDEKAAVLQHGDAGKRRLGEPLPVRSRRRAP